MYQLDNLNLISLFESLEKREIIAYFYEREGRRWHEEVHKRGGTVDQNIQSTLDSIAEDSKMYVVKAGNEIAAFFVRFQNSKGIVLEGFHIGKKFRNKDFFICFWELVKEKLGSDFKTGICSKNKPALRHLCRYGFEIVTKKLYEGQVFIILSLKK